MLDSNSIISAFSGPLGILTIITVFLAVLALSFYRLIYVHDQEKRSKFMKGFPAVMAAAVVITIAGQITMSLSGLMYDTYDLSVVEIGGEKTPADIGLEPLEEELKWAQGFVADILDWIIDSMVDMRGYILGDDLELQEMIFGAEANVLVNLNIPLKTGGTINLYNMIMSVATVIIYFMVVRTAYTAMEVAYDNQKGVMLRESLFRWYQIPVMIALMPLFYTAFVTMVGSMLGMLNNLDLSNSYMSIYDLKIREYGFGIFLGKAYMLFIEYKVWTIMFFREIVINGVYVFLPISIALTGHPNEFDSFNVALDLMLRFLFIPFYYGLAYIVIMVVLAGMENGKNPIVVIIGLGFVFKLVEIYVLITTVRRGVQQNRAGDPGNAASVFAMGVTTMTMIGRAGSGRGPSSSNQSGSRTGSSVVANTIAKSTIAQGAINIVKNASSNMAKNITNTIGQNKGLSSAVSAGTTGLRAGAATGSLLGAAAGSSMARAGLSTMAGVGTFLATGNPMAGVGAASGAGMLHKAAGPALVGAGKGAGSVVGTLAGAGGQLAGERIFGSENMSAAKSTAGKMFNRMGANGGSPVSSTDYKTHPRT